MTCKAKADVAAGKLDLKNDKDEFGSVMVI